MTTLIQSNALFGILFLACTAIVVSFLYNLFLSPLKDVPGPFLARFTRFWELICVLKGNFQETLINLHEEHGAVVRLSPNVYSFSSLEDQKKIYSLSGKFSKTQYYHAASTPGQPNLFNMTSEKEHTGRRRLIANLYSMSSMVNYEEAVDRMNAVCIRKMGEIAQRGKAILIPRFVQAYAFDVIGEVTLDHNFGMMESEGDVDDMMKLTKSAIKYQGIVGIVPELHRFCFWLQNKLGFKNAYPSIARVAMAQLEKHRHLLIEKPNPRAEPFITKLIKLEMDGRLRPEQVLEPVLMNIGAGSDTTGVTLSAALYHLYRTPAALRSLRKEINEMAAAGKISDPISFNEARDMPYLQATIMETLRIYPTIGYLLPRRVPEGGVELSGKFFPEGTTVGVSAWVLHRNQQIYGADANDFRPERFLGQIDSKTSAGALGTSFSFGAGTRTCLGKNISLLELTKVIPQIVRNFDLVFEDEKPWETYTSWLVWQKFYCRIEPRSSV